MDKNDFLKNFADQFDETDAEELTMGTEFHELEEWSSLIALAVLNMISKKYGKTVTFDEMRACVTVEDLFNVVDLK
jgi:acyl carrier protein